MIIPNLAIHMNRDVNKGVGINNQVDLMPVLDSIPEDERTTDYFLSFLARELSVEKSDIIDFELNTFCMEEPCFVGVNDTMISSPRIDNQSSCRALLDAIEDGNRADGINIIALFDHEEIGSNSKQGAASIMLHDMLRRILRNMDLSENEIDESIYDAMLLSVDVAHALHPNKRKRWISQICLSWEKAFVSSRRARSRMLRMHRLLLFYVSCVMKRAYLTSVL